MKKVVDYCKNNILTYIKESFNIMHIFVSLIVGFIVASTLTLLDNPVKDFVQVQAYLQHFDKILFWLAFVLSSILLFTISMLLNKKKILFWALWIASSLFAVTLVSEYTYNIYINVGIAVVIFIIFMFLNGDNKLELDKIDIKLSYNKCLIITGVAATIFFLVFAITSSLSYKTFVASTFDFGIFAQAMENMAKTGVPMTTIERGKELSHFAVHFSPILYIYLPIYYIFRNAITLYYFQAFVVALGAIPVFLICKKLNIKPIHSALLSIIYLLIPTMGRALYQDFHENKILAVLVLFLMYFILEEKPIPIAIFTLLTLAVKEDAAIYIFAIAIYSLITSKNLKMRLTSIIMIIVSVGYFLFALNMIAYFGGEPMLSRFEEYEVDGTGLFAMIKTIIYDIGYLIRMCFQASYSGTQYADKIMFILWIFIPMAFIPFMSKKVSTYILFVPLIVINLMQAWPYQYDIRFQYTYGSVALIVFVMVLVFSGLREELKKPLLLFMVTMSLVFCISANTNISSWYTSYYKVEKEKFTQTEQLFEKYKEELIDKKVIVDDAFSSHLTYLNNMDTKYYYDSRTDVERMVDYYIVGKNVDNEYMKIFLEMYYEKVDEGGLAVIYKLKGIFYETKE